MLKNQLMSAQKPFRQMARNILRFEIMLHTQTLVLHMFLIYLLVGRTRELMSKRHRDLPVPVFLLSSHHHASTTCRYSLKSEMPSAAKHIKKLLDQNIVSCRALEHFFSLTLAHLSKPSLTLRFVETRETVTY